MDKERVEEFVALAKRLGEMAEEISEVAYDAELGEVIRSAAESLGIDRTLDPVTIVQRLEEVALESKRWAENQCRKYALGGNPPEARRNLPA